jgi:hypothetical protein
MWCVLVRVASSSMIAQSQVLKLNSLESTKHCLMLDQALDQAASQSKPVHLINQSSTLLSSA